MLYYAKGLVNVLHGLVIFVFALVSGYIVWITSISGDKSCFFV